MAVDFNSYLPDDILVKVDRASMLASLEVRSPWLDHRLIEFAFSSVPNELRADSVSLKILPKLLARRLLPPEFNFERKQGFSIPLQDWLKGNPGNSIEELLLDVKSGVLDQSTVRGLIRLQKAGRLANTERLFALALFQLWSAHYRVSFN